MTETSHYKQICPDIILERFHWSYTTEIDSLAENGFIEDGLVACNLLVAGFIRCRRVNLSEKVDAHCIFDAVTLTEAGKIWVFRIREVKQRRPGYTRLDFGDPFGGLPDEPTSIFREDILLSSTPDRLRFLYERSDKRWTRELPEDLHAALRAGDWVSNLCPK